MEDRWSAGFLPYPKKLFRNSERGGSPFWNKRRVFSEHEAWEYLWVRSAHAAHDFAVDGGRIIHLETGETPPSSIRYLMRAWGWKSRKKVEAFIKTLLSMGEMRKGKSTQNGDTYVFVNPLPTQFRGDSGGTAGGQRGDEVVKLRASKTPTPPARAAPESPEVFNRAWAALPRREESDSKPAAWRSFQARVKQGVNPEEMAAGAERYGAYCDATGKSGTAFVKQGKTFFGPDRWFEGEYEIPSFNGNGRRR